MPKRKEPLKGWKIVFIDCKESHDNTRRVMASFEITSNSVNEKFIGPICSKEFIDDYFNIPGTGGIEQTDRRSVIIKEKEELFKKWSLVKIEECIDNSSFIEHPQINDPKWAKEIEEGNLEPSSIEQDINTYIYTPEKRLGFC